MLSPVGLHTSATRVDQSKAAEVRIMQLSPQMTRVSSWLTSPRNSKGAPNERGVGKCRFVFMHDFHTITSRRAVWGFRSVYGVKSCKIVFYVGHFLFTSSDTCCRTHHLATMHSITDRRTDGRTLNTTTGSFFLQFMDIMIIFILSTSQS